LKLTVEQLDTLQELVNIGVGRAAGVLNGIIGSPIRLRIPYVRILSAIEVKQELEKRLGSSAISSVKLGFTGSFAGSAQLVFPIDSAAKLVSVVTDEDIDTIELNALKIGTLTEVGNIVINGVMGSISNVLKQRLNYELPSYIEDTVENLLTLSDLQAPATVLLAQTRFTIEKFDIEGDIILIFQVGSFNTLLSAINNFY
jgi:chemotaxis protein CheC